MSFQPPCCATPPEKKPPCCDTGGTAKPRADYLFWGGLCVVVAGYATYLLWPGAEHAAHDLDGLAGALGAFSAAVYDIVNTIYIGLVLGILAMAVLNCIPRDFIMAVLGSGRGVRGILRATFAGVLLDLCSHGILMVGAKLYERGASVGQLMAFLIASPWNSLSLTLVLWTMIGWELTLLFIVLSMLVGILTGIVFDALVTRGVLPANPHSRPLTTGFRFWPAAKQGIAGVQWTPRFLLDTLLMGLRDSKMILRWLFLGVIIAAALRAFLSPDVFAQYLGPSLMGLFITLVAATVIEVCSEGSTPIAADIVTRAAAPGNGFTFLMAGVATDYTEIMVIREATKSWKIALFLPLVTVPQVLLVGWVLNVLG